MAHTILQLLSYAHEKHERPYTQVGLDRLQQMGALTDHFPPHDCSLEEEEIRDEPREVIVNSGEKAPGKEKSLATSQKANGGAGHSRQTNTVHPVDTDPALDADEGDGRANASHSSERPTAVNRPEDHTRCRYLRHYLNLHWASFNNIFRRQPIDHIREYYGESIAWYFAWAGKIRYYEYTSTRVQETWVLYE